MYEERLTQACEDGDLDVVKALIEEHNLSYRALCNDDDIEELPILSTACEHGHVHIVKWLCVHFNIKSRKDLTEEDMFNAIDEATGDLTDDMFCYLERNKRIVAHGLFDACDAGQIMMIDYLCSKYDFSVDQLGVAYSSAMDDATRLRVQMFMQK